MLEDKQELLTHLMRGLAVHEGSTPSPLPGVCFTRQTSSIARSPAIYEPGIVIIGEGIKRGYFNGQVFQYDRNNYLVLSVPLPAECEVVAQEQSPMISLRIDIAGKDLVDLLLDINSEDTFSVDRMSCTLAPTPMTEDIADAVIRLLKCLNHPTESRVLGPNLVREIMYWVLQEEQGNSLRALAAQKGNCAQINKALRQIHSNYNDPISIDMLSRKAGMSKAVFHRYFKAATSTSPIQYIKAIRLHRARMLILKEGVSAGAAAGLVGYESISQFSREYKRYFGITIRDESTLL